MWRSGVVTEVTARYQKLQSAAETAVPLQDGDPDRKIQVPPGFDVELYTRRDIERLLGDHAWCISFKDSACRCFGFMVRPRCVAQALRRTHATRASFSTVCERACSVCVVCCCTEVVSCTPLLSCSFQRVHKVVGGGNFEAYGAAIAHPAHAGARLPAGVQKEVHLHH